jgi:hypothetical protein
LLTAHPGVHKDSGNLEGRISTELVTSSRIHPLLNMNINDFIEIANQVSANDLIDLANQVTAKLNVFQIDLVQETPVFKSWYTWQVG